MDQIAIVLLDCRNLLQFDAVGFQGRLDGMLASASQRRGWLPPNALASMNVSSHPDRRLWHFVVGRAGGQPLLLPGGG